MNTFVLSKSNISVCQRHGVHLNISSTGKKKKEKTFANMQTEESSQKLYVSTVDTNSIDKSTVQ